MHLNYYYKLLTIFDIILLFTFNNCFAQSDIIIKIERLDFSPTCIFSAKELSQVLNGNGLLQKTIKHKEMKQKNITLIISEFLLDIRKKITDYYNERYLYSGVKTIEVKNINIVDQTYKLKIKINIVEGKFPKEISVIPLTNARNSNSKQPKLKLSSDYIYERLRIAVLDNLTDYKRSTNCKTNGDKNHFIPLDKDSLKNGMFFLKKDQCINNVHLIVNPGKNAEDTKIIAKIEESKSIYMDCFLNNYSSPNIGPFKKKLSIKKIHIIDIGDTLELDFGINFDYKLKRGHEDYSISYTFPTFGFTPNSKVTMNYNRSNSEIISEILTELDITSEKKSFSLFFQKVFKKFNSKKNLTSESYAAMFKFERYATQTKVKDQSFSFSGGENGKTVVTALRFTPIEYIYRNFKHIFYIRPTLNCGLDMMGATINEKRPGGNFLYFQLDTQYLGEIFSFIPGQQFFSLNMQLSEFPLLPGEKISIGGVSSVRGFRENRLAKENALVSTIELRTQQKKFDCCPRINWEGCFFFDYGTGWNSNDDGDVANDRQTRSIYSVGIGVKWHTLDKIIKGELYLGIPMKFENLGRKPPEIEDPQDKTKHQDQGIHFQVSGHYSF